MKCVLEQAHCESEFDSPAIDGRYSFDCFQCTDCLAFAIGF